MSKDIFDVLHLLELYSDLKSGNVKNMEDYALDEKSFLCISNEYKHQLDGVDEGIINMVNEDVDDMVEEDYIHTPFELRELCKQKLYKELGIEYKTIMDFCPDVHFY